MRNHTSTALAAIFALGLSFPAAAQEAATYGTYDADQNNVLEQEEYTAIGETFGQWDTDQSGTLDEEEFNAFYEESFGETNEQTAQLFDTWDADDDQMLTEDEFASEEAFATWDEDQSGALEEEEGWFD